MERMKTHNHEQPKGISDAEFEAILHAALRDEGCLFPCNAEEIALLKASMDMSGIPTPDTQKFQQLLHQIVEKVVKLPSTTKVSSCEVDENIEKLAMAARNGGEITEEIRKRMDTDRARAREQTHKNNGAH
jgi:hypothetical protein